MKIRSDFVSNSSSCSFSVSDVKKTTKLLNKLGSDVNWNLEEDLEISIHYKHKYAKEIFEFFNPDEKYKEPDPYFWNGEWTKPDPESCDYLSVRIYQLISITPDIASKIEIINFSCDDYKDLVKLVLAMLYQYFTNHGVECDKSYTEINWDENEDTKNNFIFNLAKEFNKKGK